MGKIVVHEFTTLDGVIEDPAWTRDHGFDPKMGEAIGAMMGSCKALLLGRRTFEMFAPAWSNRTAPPRWTAQSWPRSTSRCTVRG